MDFKGAQHIFCRERKWQKIKNSESCYRDSTLPHFYSFSKVSISIVKTEKYFSSHLIDLKQVK